MPFANQQLTADVAGEAAAVGSPRAPAAVVRAVLVLPTVLPNWGNAAELGSVKSGWASRPRRLPADDPALSHPGGRRFEPG